VRCLTLIIGLLFCGSALARWLTVEEAGSVLENFRIEYEVFKDGTWNQLWDYTIRVQSEDAKTSAGLFNIEYNAFTDQVEVIEAYTQNGKEKIPVLPTAIEDRDKGESRDYDVLKVRSLVFPQVQIGSKVHIKYRIRTIKPLVKNRWSTVVGLSPGYHVEKMLVRIKSERPLSHELQDSRGLVNLKAKNRFNLEITNKKVLPGWVHAEKDPYFHPDSNTELWVTTESRWDDFFDGFAQEYEKILAQRLPAGVKPILQSVAAKKTNEEKILSLLEKISHDYRYFGDWRRHDGGLVPRPLIEIEKSHYGDCKDLAALLTAMLRSLKIEANMVLVRRGENPWIHEPDYRIPSAHRFNHAIVRVKSGEKTYWLDPTNPVASLEPYPDISGRPGFVVTAKGGEFDRLPDPKPEDFEHDHEYEYRFDHDDSVSVRLSAHLKHLAPYQIANELMLAPRSEVLSSTLEYFTEGQELKTFRYLREPSTGRVLKDMDMALEYRAGRVTFRAGKASFFVIPDGFLSGAFYETDDRESDMRLAEEPFRFRGIRRLKDTRLVQELPEPCRVESRWMTLDRQVRIEGRDLIVVQNVDLRRPFIKKTEFRTGEFKRLQEEARRCFYRGGLLVGSQKGTLSSHGG
jgi:hypothetical protein